MHIQEAFLFLVQQGCGGTSSYNNTYFVNPNFPSTYSGSRTCTYTVQRCNSDICQLRIDFLSLSLAQPNADGRCTTDVLTITGSAGRFTPICGENSGHHVYLGFNGDQDIKITIVTTGSSVGRSWKLKVAQIECDSPSRGN